MSTKVTVTETTSTMSPTLLSCNMGVLKTPSGFLKLFEVIIGVLYFILFLAFMIDLSAPVYPAAGILFLGNVPFLLTTFQVLLSMLISPMVANTLPKLVFEFLYHLFAFAFYLMTGLAVLVLVSKHHKDALELERGMSLAVLGLINCIFFFLSTHHSFKSYKED